MIKQTNKNGNLSKKRVISPTVLKRLGLLSAVTLATLATGAVVNTPHVHAGTYSANPEINLTPKFTPGLSKFVPVNTGDGIDWNYYVDNGDVKNNFVLVHNKPNTRVKYTNVMQTKEGKWLDMVITIPNARYNTPKTQTPVYSLAFGTDHISVSMDTQEYYPINLEKIMEGVTIDITEHAEGNAVGKLANLGTNKVALAYTDLEPINVKINGQLKPTLYQRVQNTGAFVPVEYWTDVPGSSSDAVEGKSAVDKNYAKSDLYVMSNGITIPNGYWGYTGSFINIYNNWKASGAVAVYGAGKNHFTMDLMGAAPEMDLFYFSEAKVTPYPKPIEPIEQPAPIKRIDYNGELSTDASFTDARDEYTYELSVNTKEDENTSGVGYTLTDSLPKGFKVTSVQAVNGGEYFTNNSKDDINKTGNFKATANKNVFDVDHLVKYRITGTIDRDTAWTQTELHNEATATVPKGSRGGGTSNDTTMHIPRRDINFNFYNFDHNDKRVKVAKTYQNIPVGYGITDTFSPVSTTKDLVKESGVDYADKDFILSKAIDNGLPMNSAPIYNEENTRKATDVNLYYRTKWSADVLHEVVGTKPANTDKINPDGDLIARNSSDFYYKTDDGKSINDLSYLVRTDLKDSSGRAWIPVTQGGTQKAIEGYPVMRIDYDQLKVTTKIDWIQLDTPKVSETNAQQQYRYTVVINHSYPLYDISKMPDNTDAEKEVKNQANNANYWYKSILDHTNVNFTDGTSSKPTSSTSDNTILSDIVKPNTLSGSVTNKKSKFYADRASTDTKLSKFYKKDDDLKVNAKLAISGTNTDWDNYVIPVEDTAQTHIHMASEKVFKNTDLTDTKTGSEIKYSSIIRTLYNGTAKNVTDYRENYNMVFNKEYKQKSGYFIPSEMNISYNADTDQQSFTAPRFTYGLPNYLYNGDRKARDKNDDKFVDLEVPNSKVNTAEGLAPKLPDLNSWKKQDFKSDIKYQQEFSDLKNGDLNTLGQLKVKPSTSDITLNGGNNLYIPVWADVKSNKDVLKYKSTKSNNSDTLETTGVNSVSFDLTKTLTVTAQMYSDNESKTKGKDELYMQPIFTDSGYTNLPSNLNAKDKSWLTSATDRTVKD